jgi:opacity protein-like surface antigen
MRIIRSLVAGLALTSLLPITASAQTRTQFENSWFWGVKGGGMTVRTMDQSKFAPTVGIDWLITRSRGGLYVSVEQGFFDEMQSVVLDTLSTTSMLRTVDLKNIRRASFAMMVFPGSSPFLRPYAGAGVALNLIQSATPQGTFNDVTHAMVVGQEIEDRRTRTALLLMGGLQAQYTRVALFGQATWMPTGSQYLLDGDDQTWLVEAGLRFNVGSAIEKLR